MISAHRRLQDWCISAFGLGVVITGVSLIDQTCRRFIFDALHGEIPGGLPVGRIHDLTRSAAAYLPAGNTSFVAFGVAAVVLVVVMFRS